MKPSETPLELVLATRNLKKKAEMLRLIKPDWEPNERLARLSILTLEDFDDVPEVVEDADSFLGNARKKAVETARFLKRWVLADDSGLAVDALQGAPGVHSARYSGVHGDDQANNQKLLLALADVPDSRRGAAFVCALALADPSGAIRLETEASCRGVIIREPRGPGGFGYDPLFLIPEYHRTFGELSALTKHQLSHRSRAFARLRAGLEKIGVDSFGSRPE
ncbi:MAG: RdgB/HAM1 family non-canonical purine NTP pyrophosphatase [Isosphaeraceae bacterium]